MTRKLKIDIGISELEGGNNDGALHIGAEEDGPIFWDYRTNELVAEDTPEPLDLGDQWVGDYIVESREAGHWTETSALGAFLAAVADNADTPGTLGRRQATVFALRDLAGVSRRHTARALDIAPSTVDSTLETSRQKVAASMAVADTLD